MTTEILMAGFGGQGILFATKQLAKAALAADRQVTWIPSYGPEARGGTSNCSVIISDEQIGSPIVVHPDILIALNLQSFDKFCLRIKPGGMLIVDSSLVGKKTERTDITVYEVPATALASEQGLTGSANIIMLGKLLAVTGLFERDEFVTHLVEGIPESRAAMREINRKAFEIGYHYTA